MTGLRPHVATALKDKLPVQVNEKEASIILGRAIPTLRNWRSLGRPPRFFKVGRSVTYQLLDLIEFLDARAIEPRPER